MRVVSLFSGGGLGDLGFMMAGCEIVAQVEIDDYCQKILNLRWPDVPKWRDIREVKGKELPKCDIITGGFPCQPFSVAGKQKGKDDNRHLWPEMSRIISEVKPAWVVGENVSGFIRLSLDDVLNDLESIGYETTTIVFPAHALGAPHRRERVWIIANTSTRLFRQAKHEKQTTGVEQLCETVADPKSGRQSRGNMQIDSRNESENQQEQQNFWRAKAKRYFRFWETEPDVGRVAHGVPKRMDRLKLLGNGQVPACTKWIAERIMEYDTQNLRRQ